MRMVVEGELLKDGDAQLSFPDRPPELTQMFEVEAKAAEVESLAWWRWAWFRLMTTWT